MTAQDKLKPRGDFDAVRSEYLFPYLHGNVVVYRFPARTCYKHVDKTLFCVGKIVKTRVKDLMRKRKEFYALHYTVTAFLLELVAERADTAYKIGHQIAAKKFSARREAEHLTHKIQFDAVNIISFKRLFYIRIHQVANLPLLVIERARVVSVGDMVMYSVCFGVFKPKLCEHGLVIFRNAVNVVHAEGKPRANAYLPEVSYPAFEDIEIIADKRLVIRVVRFFENVSVFIDGLAVFVEIKPTFAVTVNRFRRINGTHKIDVYQKIGQLRAFVLTHKLSFALLGKTEALVIGLSRCPCFSDMVVGVFVKHYADMRRGFFLIHKIPLRVNLSRRSSHTEGTPPFVLLLR